jgi:hypothetical protein
MPWSAPAEDEILSEFTPEETTILQTLQGATDRLPAILERVVAEIPDAIRSGGYALAADSTTLPLSLHGDAIALARWRWLASLPSLPTLQTAPRAALAAAAEARIGQIATQQFSPEPPVAPVTTPAGAWNSERKLLSRLYPVRDNFANPSAPADN